MARESGRSAAPAAEDSGPVLYQSPEQRGNEPLDARSDLFSLGLVLCVMLTGRPPVGVGAALSKPSAINPDVPSELDAIVERATMRRVGDRYQSAAPLAAELGSFSAILEVRSGDREPPIHVGAMAPRPVPSSRRDISLMAIAAAVLGVAVWLWFVP